MAITLDGTTGITTPGLTNTGTETIVNLTTTGNTILGDASTDTLNVGNGDLIKDASGDLLLNRTTTIDSAKFAINTTSATGIQQGIVINNPHGFGAGLGTAASGLTFTRMTSGTYVPVASVQGWNRSESTSNGGELAFSTQQTVAGGLVERMRIFYTGGVSIGNTTDPGATNLSVSGAVQANFNFADTGVASYGAGTSFTLTVSDTTEGAMYLISVSRNTTSTAATNRVSLLSYRSSGSFLTDIIGNANVTISVSGATITVTGVGTASLYGSVLGLRN
jgi:hypothetical protein